MFHAAEFFSDTSQLRQTCDENDFQCMDGTQCVSKRYLCDGEPDCLDHSDELICGIYKNYVKRAGAVM